MGGSRHLSNYKLRFRQVHLDFHTSPHIPGVGESFDKAQFQECLKLGHVNSITCFSKCHHGWSYHPTSVGKIHPTLGFDLLRAQIEACKEIGVRAPIYLSAGLDSVAGAEHPEWRELSIEGKYMGRAAAVNEPGFPMMCFNSPYLDYLCEQVIEVVRLFPGSDGIFSDIIHQGECCCPWCLAYMEEHGLDVDKQEDRQACARAGLERYYRKFTEACRCDDPNIPVLHNGGHVDKSRRDLLQYFSHLELESLPTGGWGYDHFPLSAKYSQHTGLDYLGMTGKFHRSWGEFGGYKHPNALRYECGLMLANGSKCSVGDQLHPSAEMDRSTYEIIGQAYAEVEQKEPWCDDVTSVADIAVLSSEAETGNQDPDTGAGRILMQSHFLFDLIDRQVDFAPYKLLILPDEVLIDDELKSKIDRYLAGGGKLLLTGRSGLKADGSGFAFDVGAEHAGESPYQPDYIEPGDELAPSFVKSPLVMYLKSQQVRATTGTVLADIRQPYFNRTWRHFCSHQHAPAADKTEYAGAVRKGNLLYLAHPIFSIYHAIGAVAQKDYAANAIRLLLGEDQTLKTNLPSAARVTLMEQPAKRRYVLHLLYAGLLPVGADVRLSAEGYVGQGWQIEVIEDLLPLHNTKLSLALPQEVTRVTLEPQERELDFIAQAGGLELFIDEFTCHQMVVLHY